jgi:hypothetical protein
MIYFNQLAIFLLNLAFSRRKILKRIVSVFYLPVDNLCIKLQNRCVDKWPCPGIEPGIRVRPLGQARIFGFSRPAQAGLRGRLSRAMLKE